MSFSKGNNLEKAYELIHRFKHGDFSRDTEITPQQVELIRLLSDDLGIKDRSMPIERLIFRVADLDAEWNTRAQETVDRIYMLRANGSSSEADSTRQEFNQECPSQWYRDIVNSL